MENFAPIALFVYNRPEHAKKTLESLSANTLAQQSELYIFADGAKKNATTEQLQKIKNVREIIRSKLWCKTVHIFEQEENKGLANSIITGVTQIVNKHERIIVLEDDLETSPFFLQYMNDALSAYESETDVISIHAYSYPLQTQLSHTYFIKGADCWGWATWKRGWDLFNPNGSDLLKKIIFEGKSTEFNFNNTFDYTGALFAQVRGKSSSWAVRWYASAFLHNKLTLYPQKSFVKNIGLDGSGENCNDDLKYDTQLETENYFFEKIPVQESSEARKAFEKYFYKVESKNWKLPLKMLLWKLLGFCKSRNQNP